MVSLLQDQSNIKFSSSDTLERDQQDLMKTQGDSVSPIQQTVSKMPHFCFSFFRGTSLDRIFNNCSAVHVKSQKCYEVRFAFCRDL